MHGADFGSGSAKGPYGQFIVAAGNLGHWDCPFEGQGPSPRESCARRPPLRQVEVDRAARTDCRPLFFVFWPDNLDPMYP
jgi:hypothetical protein